MKNINAFFLFLVFALGLIYRDGHIEMEKFLRGSSTLNAVVFEQ